MLIVLVSIAIASSWLMSYKPLDGIILVRFLTRGSSTCWYLGWSNKWSILGRIGDVGSSSSSSRSNLNRRDGGEYLSLLLLMSISLGDPGSVMVDEESVRDPHHLCGMVQILHVSSGPYIDIPLPFMDTLFVLSTDYASGIHKQMQYKKPVFSVHNKLSSLSCSHTVLMCSPCFTQSDLSLVSLVTSTFFQQRVVPSLWQCQQECRVQWIC